MLGKLKLRDKHNLQGGFFSIVLKTGNMRSKLLRNFCVQYNVVNHGQYAVKQILRTLSTCMTESLYPLNSSFPSLSSCWSNSLSSSRSKYYFEFSVYESHMFQSLTKASFLGMEPIQMHSSPFRMACGWLSALLLSF